MEYDKIYLAFLDILGFKELIMNNSFDESKEIFETFIEQVSNSANLKNRSTGETNTVVNFNLFSDTILFWTNDDTFKSFFQLNLTVSNLLNYSMQIGLPLRGAISYGNLMCNAFRLESDRVNIINTILGTSIVRAHKLEKDQLWSGCIIDQELENTDNTELRNYLKSQWLGKFYVRYNVPLRNTGCRSMLTINWVNLDNDVFTEQKIRDSFDAHNKKSKSSDIAIKIENTLNYYKYVKNLRTIT